MRHLFAHPQRTGKPVKKPMKLAGRTNVAGRIILTLTNSRNDFLLRCTTDQKCDVAAGLQRRKCQRYPRFRTRPGHRNHPSVPFRERRRAGKQRGRMTVITHAQQHDVKQGVINRKPIPSVKSLELVLISLRREFRSTEAGPNRMNLRGRDRAYIEQRFPGHQVIAVGMVMRHKPFISPEPVNVIPRHGLADWRCRERRIKKLRRASSRKANSLPSAASADDAGNPPGHRFGEAGRIFEEMKLAAIVIHRVGLPLI